MTNPTESTPVIVERSGSAAVARLQLDSPSDDALKRLRQTIGAAARQPGVTLVILDLSRVEIVGSKELGTFIQIFNECKARKQKLKLAAATPRVRGILAIAHLDQLMELADTVEAAME